MEDNRYRIKSDLSGMLSSLAREGGALEPGDDVTVSGLKARPELNGVTGTIVCWYPDRGRYAVKVSDAEEVALKPNAWAKPPRCSTRTWRASTSPSRSKEIYPDELRELQDGGIAAVDTNRGDGVNGVNVTEAARYKKAHDDERFSGLKIEICEALDGVEFEPDMRVQARMNWGAAVQGREDRGR